MPASFPMSAAFCGPTPFRNSMLVSKKLGMGGIYREGEKEKIIFLIRVGINPLHDFQVRKYHIGPFGSCSEQSKVISLAKREYISCMSKWASGKTVKSRIILGIATKKEFTVTIK